MLIFATIKRPPNGMQLYKYRDEGLGVNLIAHEWIIKSHMEMHVYVQHPMLMPHMSTVMIVFVVNNALEVSTDIYTVVVTEAINRFAFNFDLVLKYGQIILPDY